MGGTTSSMAAKFMFFPPDPSSYTLIEVEGGGLAMAEVLRREGVEVRKVKTKTGNEIVMVFVRIPPSAVAVEVEEEERKGLALLYSHGNAMDLGQMYGLFIELSVHRRCACLSRIWQQTFLYVVGQFLKQA